MRGWVVITVFFGSLAAAQPRPLCIHVESQDAGVSGARLETTGRIVLNTDVNGNAAFYEPGLMGGDVFFTVTHPAFAHPKDGFGYEGEALAALEGGTARIVLTPRGDAGAA